MARAQVAHFEKVSFESFCGDMHNLYPIQKFSEKDLTRYYDNIILPRRANAGALGYDFVTPFEFTLSPGSKITVPTGIRCVFNDDMDGWGLFMVPKSRNARTSIRQSNTIGVVDPDYYKSDNEGDILVTLEMPNNALTNSQVSQFNQQLNMFRGPYHYIPGERFIQGIFLLTGITTDDNPISRAPRNGGFGSTGK